MGRFYRTETFHPVTDEHLTICYNYFPRVFKGGFTEEPAKVRIIKIFKTETNEDIIFTINYIKILEAQLLNDLKLEEDNYLEGE